MSWHHQLYHLPYCILFLLEIIVFLTNRLLECLYKPPLCLACQFVQSHFCPWKKKGKKTGSIRTPEQKDPGNGVSVFQIVLENPGLIPHMYGIITKQRLRGCTKIVDHVSYYVYVHLMQDLSLSDTLLYNAEMEKIMAQAGWTVKNYHADNGIFLDNGFIDAINEKDGKLTFCGMGVYHQKGIIENKNVILTTSDITILLHDIIMWPQMIDKTFWPFSIKYVDERLNSLQIDLKGRTPEYILNGIKVEYITVKYYHMLFFPI